MTIIAPTAIHFKLLWLDYDYDYNFFFLIYYIILYIIIQIEVFFISISMISFHIISYHIKAYLYMIWYEWYDMIWNGMKIWCFCEIKLFMLHDFLIFCSWFLLFTYLLFHELAN